MPGVDDGCIVLWSPRGLELIMTVFEVFVVLCMTVSKNDSACASNANSLHSAAGQESAQRYHPVGLFRG